MTDNCAECHVGDKKYRIYLKEGYTSWSYVTGSPTLQSWMGNYLNDLARGKPRKRKPPGVIRVEEIC